MGARMITCDVAVVGLGIMGAAAAWQCARAGARVVALEARGPMHEDGSSHGATRIYRQAYFEGETYLPLLRLAGVGWQELERAVSKPLMHRTGGVFVGPRASGVAEGSLRTARSAAIPHEHWNAAELHRRLPQLSVADDSSAVYEPGACVLVADDCRLAMLDEAVRMGAVLRYGEAARTLAGSTGGVRIETARGECIEAASAIVCAGPWMGELVPVLAPHVRPHRVPIYWFRPRDGRERDFQGGRLPVFIHEFPDGVMIYGIPMVASADPGVKIGFHNRQQVACDPSDPRPEMTDALRTEIAGRVGRIFPDLEPMPIAAKWCWYTMAADESFVIGGTAQSGRIHYASACSGHGFKFATGVGAVLAALAAGRALPVDIERFSVRRFP